MNFILFKQQWESRIIFSETGKNMNRFIDIGAKLPLFLKTWRHTHIIRNKEEGSEIIDSIEYSSGYSLLDYLLFPAMYLQFLYRKPVYRKIFEKPASKT